jgi:phospholipid/cholesterol/gamma-HCH transport system ATP-binding protein
MKLELVFLFQNAALDSMTVKQNLAFTLKRHATDLTPEEIEREIEIVLESVGLAQAINKMPSELSGGMRKERWHAHLYKT